MAQTLAFDVYGTLINTSGVFDKLNSMIPDKAEPFMKLWRQKQLEYSFRRGLMKQHTDFSVCTRDALDYCCTAFDVSLNNEQIQALLNKYTTLPAYPDVSSCLSKCRDAGHKLYAFSNGSASAVKQLLDHTGNLTFFDGIISTEDVHMFKPSPVVYYHFTKQTDSSQSDTWLISGNPFDVMGARSCGWNAVWVQRQPDQFFDPWGEFEPTATIQHLNELQSVLSEL